MTSIQPQLSDITAATVIAASRELLAPALRTAVATLPDSMSRIAGYHLGWWDPAGRPELGDTGKALRPALALSAARAVGGDASAAVPVAVAIELVHNFSLLHDDVMDGDGTRRHRPTAWTVFGTNAAILAGNALLTLAFNVIAHDQQAVWRLTDAVQELLDGQSADLSFERRIDVSVAECRQMAIAKTGALLGCACELGGLAGGASSEQSARLRGFGRRLGLAFQFVDDLLGIWGNPTLTGKPVHSDLRSRKKSLPVVAAMNSGTQAGEQLAALYGRELPLSRAELGRAAGFVELGGGRDYGQDQADALLASAMEDLTAAAGSRGDELAALALMATHRER